MKLSKLLAASFLLLAFLVASTVQQDVESDNNPAANDKIDDMTDVEVVPETKKEVVEVDENSAAEAAAGSGEAAAAAGQSQAKTDDEAATVIKEATERLEKLKEKGSDDTEQQQPAVVEAVHSGASHDDDASSLGLKPEAVVAASDDSESKIQEVPVAEKQVEKEEPSVVEIINDSAPGDIAELKQPSAVKSSETESEIAPAAPAVVAEAAAASSGESEQSQSQSKDEASDSSSSSDSKSSDVEYKDEDVKKPEEVRANEVIPDPYDEVKSSENQAAAAKSDDDKLLLQPEPIKSGVSVGESMNKPAAVASESEPTIVKDGETAAVGGAGSNSNPRPFKVNQFFIIIPGIVLAIVVLFVVIFVVYNKTSLCRKYEPVSQEARPTIYRGGEGATTSSAQV